MLFVCVHGLCLSRSSLPLTPHTLVFSVTNKEVEEMQGGGTGSSGCMPFAVDKTTDERGRWERRERLQGK